MCCMLRALLQAFKWEVKQVAPLVRGLTGAAYGDAPPAQRHGADVDASRLGDVEIPQGDGETATQRAAAMSTSTISETETTTTTTTTPGDELPEPGTTRSLLAKFQYIHEATSQ